MPQHKVTPRIAISLHIAVNNTSIRAHVNKDGELTIVEDNRLNFSDPRSERYVYPDANEITLIEALEHIKALTKYALGHDRFAADGVAEASQA